MPRFLAASTSASAILLFSTAAMADVTSAQVWAAWQNMNASTGQSMTAGKEDKADGSVTLTDLAYKSGDDATHVTGTIPMVKFTDQGDGTVAVTMSDSYELAVAHDGPSGEKFTNSIKLAQNGQKIVVSGTPETMSYDFSADTVSVDAGNFTKDGEPYDLDIATTLKSVSAGYVLKPGDKLDLATTLAISAIDFKASGTGPADDETDADPEGTDTGNADTNDTTGDAPKTPSVTGTSSFDVAGTLSGVAAVSTSTMNGPADASGDLAKMLAAGFATQSAFNYDSLNLDGSMTDPEGSVTSYSSRNGAGKLNLAIDADHLSYDLMAADASVTATVPSAPVSDISFGLKQSMISILVPLAKSDIPKPFGVNFTMRGLTFSDAIWGLFDPQSTIPRDPANVVIDLKGTATPKVSLANPAGMDAVQAGDGPPADLNTLEIADLEVAGGGALLKGTGKVAFDQSKPKVLGGSLPMPTGKINLSLDGANDLMGKLMTLGILQPQMMMGFGMVTAMIAKPGATPDSLVSEIEFTADGKILANGNPLPIGP